MCRFITLFLTDEATVLHQNITYLKVLSSEMDPAEIRLIR
jgi:hypothetical protein